MSFTPATDRAHGYHLRRTSYVLCPRILAALALAASLGLPAASSAQQGSYTGLGAGSIPPETVAKYAPTPLSPEVTARIQAMLDVRSPSLGVLSPDGKKLFFSWNVTGSNQIWRLDAPRSFPVQMTGGEERTSGLDVTPDGRWLIVSRDEGGQENPGLYLQPTAGGPLQTIQRIDKVQTFFEFVTDDSKSIYFRSNDVKPDSFAIYRRDLNGGERTLVMGDPGLWSISDHRGSGNDLRLLLEKATGSVSAEYWEWSAATKKSTPLLGVGETTEFSARYAADPAELLVQTNKFGDFQRVYRWRIGSGADEKSFHAVSPDVKMDVAGFSIDEARKHVYLLMNDGGYTRLRVLDAKTYAPEIIPFPADAEQTISGAESRDGRFVTVGVATAKAPTAAFVWDWTTKTLTQWSVPGAPEIDLARFVPAKLMTYPAKDGTPIPMFVRFPKGCGPEENTNADPCPIVVEFHGGPEGQAQPGFSPNAQLFVDAGFVFVQPNVRGSDGYGKRWLNADNGPKRLDVIGDIDDCGKWVRAHWGRNGKPPKVGITGGSYGGYATLVGMTMFAGTYDAGASVVGISNLVTFLRNTSPYRRMLRVTEYGDPDKDAEALRKLSPVTYLDRVKAPLLLIQGVNDPRVPANEAVQIHDALEKRGVASQLILIPDEGHGSAKRSNRVIQIGHVVQFFEEQLLPKKPA